MTPARRFDDGIPQPRLIYGTAWKEERTADLTELAIRQGFRAIDTANQRKHYFEEAVGQGISRAISTGMVTREDLFLQTKFTFQGGQDHRLPYDPAATVAIQVEQSFAGSLIHLDTDYLDSYVLHGPSVRSGLADVDWQAWGAIESLFDRGQIRFTGISNVALPQLELLCSRARIRPRFVQNRCYARTGWDREVRELCAELGILYQGFSLLTGNVPVVQSPAVAEIARRHQCSPAQVVFRFSVQIGMIPLTGTSSAEHMQLDLDSSMIELTAAEVTTLERIVTSR
jgi:diketogulonate reductase-like aldo/keto reductase